MTIDQFIQTEQNKSVKYPNYYYQKVISEDNLHVIMNYQSIMDRYVQYIRDYITEIELSQEEMRKYRYNPKRLSFNLYGTTSYWWSIIFANQIHSLTEFDFSRDNVIKVFTREGISAFSTVLSVDKTFISENQSEVSKDRKSVTSMLQKQNAEEINASST
jgi:hypothetical protein